MNQAIHAAAFCLVLAGARLMAADEDPAWKTLKVPGAWEASGLEDTRDYDGMAWYRTWLKPHPSYFTPHERNLYAESVTLTVRDLGDAHELYVNGKKVGSGGSMPPNYKSGLKGNHRHKVPPGLLVKDQWNAIAFRVYNPSGPGGFLGKAPFIMDYFMECEFEGVWEFRLGDDPDWAGTVLKDKPASSAFDQYHESYRLLGEADQFVTGPKLTPDESFKKFKVADGLAVEELLTEPLVAQPVHLSFDGRGRLWVSQYRQYPYPAGVKPISRDKYYRTHYSKVPPAPPNHDRGRDRITIHEDVDGDGRFDRHKVFLDGLNMANAALPGRGGVWVMHTPYLLFYPDQDGNDEPDGPPVVHLEGFGLEDSHSVANGLVWGMDGWIYGGQGSTTSSRVTRPGLDPPDAPGVHFEGCMVWRYHPQTRKYELFAEGSGNVFGLEIDSQGRLFSGHNGADTRGWHYVQGGYYLKQGLNPGKFGPPRNPYSFGVLPMMKSETPAVRFTHGIAVVEGTAFSENHRNNFFSLDPIHNVVIEARRTPRGATFQTADLGHVLSSEDPAFRPVFIVNGPDGSMLLADFYDFYIAHGQHYQSQIDPTTGRIYRLRDPDLPLEEDRDLRRKTTQQLVSLLTHPNKWHRQTAVRLLGERRDPAAAALLKDRIRSESGPGAREALWALHQGFGLDPVTARMALNHEYPAVREWTVRLLADHPPMLPTLARAVQRRARVETEVTVRAQMASSARRLPAVQAVPLAAALMRHEEDVDDPYVPLLCWWVLEAHSHDSPDVVLGMLDEAALWKAPMVVRHMLPRLMKRFAMSGRRQDLMRCARLLTMSPGPEATAALMQGFEEAFRGRSAAGLPTELVKALDGAGLSPLALQLRQGDEAAIDKAIALLKDPKTAQVDKLQYIRILGEVRAAKAQPVLLSFVSKSHTAPFQRAALAALTVFDDESIGRHVVQQWSLLDTQSHPAALTLLASREAWSRPLLEAVKASAIPADSVPQEIRQRLRQHGPEEDRELAAEVFPDLEPSSPDQRKQQLAALEATLNEGSGNPYKGETVYMQRCAGCHKLFFKGGNIGPDLTGYQRDNLGTMLMSIVDPNAEIREGFQSVEVETHDGRSFNGFLAERDQQVVVIRGLDGQDVTLEASQVKSLETLKRSLMPEGLLEGLKAQELRDLFAFLRSSQPFTR